MKKNLLLIFLIPFFFILLAGTALPAPKMSVAVLDLTPENVPGIVASAVSAIIRSEFVNMGNFIIVERAQMNAILKEQGLQMTGCTDSSCAVKLGKILSARRIVIGELNKVGGKILITARYVNVSSGESLFSSSDRADGLDDIDSVTRRLARKLAERIVAGDKEVIIPRTVSGYYLRSIVPGWGQFYAGNSTKGYIYSSLFALSGLFAAGSGTWYFMAKNDYDSLGSGATAATIKSKRDAYNNSTVMVNVSVGLMVAVYAVHWIDILFFTKVELDRQLAAVNRSPVFVTCYGGLVSEDYTDKGIKLGIGIKF